jgi:transcriptional regulator
MTELISPTGWVVPPRKAIVVRLGLRANGATFVEAAEKMGTSKENIHMHLKQATEYGYHIERASGRFYVK